MTKSLPVSSRSRSVLNGAASQLDRIRNAPAPERVEVDGRSLAQLLAFGARFGALLVFRDLDNLPNGDWSGFFLSDPAVASAVHGSLDLPEIEQALLRLRDEIEAARDDGERGSRLRRLVEAAMRLLSILDRSPPSAADAGDWLVRLAGQDRRDDLGQVAVRLRFHLDGRHPDEWLGQGWVGCQPSWLDGLLSILDDLVACLIQALRHGAAKALADAEASLSSLGHAPQAALYNAFVVLFAEARREMNRFPRRLLDFYYGEVLRQQDRAAHPDQVYLTFTPAKGVEFASIPAGTLFSAGVDADGEAINYAADAPLEVVASTVTALKVHHVAQGSGSDAVFGVLSGQVLASPDGMVPAGPFPIFGTTQVGTTGALVMQPAEIGFVVSSPTLTLYGGSRSVAIGIMPAGLPSPSGTDAAGEKADQDLSTALAQMPDQMQSALAIYFTTAGGWVAVPGFSVAGTADGSITISFDLPADAPPLVPLSTKPAPGAPTPTLPASAFPDPGDEPAVLAQVQMASGDNAFAALSRLRAESVTVSVSVSGLVPKALSTPSGPVDMGQNFSIFGLVPAQGGTLRMVVPELFVKQPSSLSVTIDWAGLPVTSTGFQGYYKGYVLDADGQVSTQPLFDNTSFQATLDVVSPGSWVPSATPSLYLFQSAPASTTAAGATTTSTTGTSGTGASSAESPPAAPPAPETVAPVPDAPVLASSVLAFSGITAQPAPAFYNPSSSALALTLVAPAYAFGNVLYSSNLSAASRAGVARLQAGSRQVAAGSTQVAATQISQGAATNATADDRSWARGISKTVGNAISALNGGALAALHDAIAGSDAPDEAKSSLAQSLESALAGAGEGLLGGLWNKLTGKPAASDPSSVTARLKSWLEDNAGTLGGSAKAGEAKGALAAAGTLASSLRSAGTQPPAVGRPAMAAAFQSAQATLGASASPPAPGPATPVVMPNVPWLPTASRVTLSYTASAIAAVTPYGAGATGQTDGSATNADGSAGGNGGAAGGTMDGRSTRHHFRHLTLFGELQPAHGSDRVADGNGAPGIPVLPEVPSRASLYIELSAPTRWLTLLFILQAGPDGWPTVRPKVRWEQRVGNGWLPARVLSDGTNGLLNTGIVSLELVTPPGGGTPTLRAWLQSGMNNACFLKSVTTNALVASWVGPGGATQLGTPLPAGTITQGVATLDGIGSIAQPEPSIGGYPAAVGPAFDLWMAERLRHKGFAVQGWDYARIVLAAIPSLWQLAVVPATDAATGEPAPGMVWVVAVAGPTTPNVTDITEPMASPEVLSEIGNLLRPLASPFARIVVTNPPYVRLTVVADLVFDQHDTAAAYEDKAGADLVRWLSPWPDPTLGPRPPDYYTRQSIADFLKRRPYVKEVTSLHIEWEQAKTPGGWCYATSAVKHRLRGQPPVDTGTAGGGPGTDMVGSGRKDTGGVAPGRPDGTRDRRPAGEGGTS